jgi:hypothetical protein
MQPIYGKAAAVGAFKQLDSLMFIQIHRQQQQQQ